MQGNREKPSPSQTMIERKQHQVLVNAIKQSHVVAPAHFLNILSSHPSIHPVYPLCFHQFFCVLSPSSRAVVAGGELNSKAGN